MGMITEWTLWVLREVAWRGIQHVLSEEALRRALTARKRSTYKAILSAISANSVKTIGLRLPVYFRDDQR